MVADEKKIAALKAIRDKTRAEMAASQPEPKAPDQILEEDDSFPPHEDFEEDQYAGRYRPEVDEDDFYSDAEPNFPDDTDENPEDTQDEDTHEDDDFSDENDDEENSDDEDEGTDDTDDDDDDSGDNPPPPPPSGEGNSWRAIALFGDDDLPAISIDFNGKNLENGEFDHENLRDANFSVANLKGVNFSGSDLRGADFSGADLTNTNLSGANLSDANFSGAQLIGTNFTGAVLKNVTFTDAFFQNAILIDLDIDSISLEELQQLIEFVAKYYPEKLDLSRINLTMLDLKKIDLSKVNLRGVDFTGVDFTGVNIMELDLSECIITPEQIAQALGRVPTQAELKRILAPKRKKAKSGPQIDFTDFFLNGHKQVGVYNVGGFKGMDTEKLVKFSQKAYKMIKGKGKAPVKDEEALEHIRQQNKANKEALRQVIEERKRRELENRSRQKQKTYIPRDRGGYER